MRYGMSAAALIVHDKPVLLVNHKATGQYDFWLPPGGRLEGEESIFECAKREAFEETGLNVEPDRILYIYVDYTAQTEQIEDTQVERIEDGYRVYLFDSDPMRGIESDVVDVARDGSITRHRGQLIAKPF